MITELYKGDAINLRSTLGIPISGWKIRAEIWDSTGHFIKKATANSGGSDAEIQITNATTGVIVIYINTGETAAFDDTANYEVEAETLTGQVYTVVRDGIMFDPEKIDWTTP